MTRILAFTDPHREHGTALALMGLARRERPDLILCAGDISFFGMEYEGFLRQLSVLRRDIFYVPGNHDEGSDWKGVSLFPFMKDVSLRTVDAGAVRIAGLPGSMDFWPGGREDKDICESALLQLGAPDRAKPLIVLSHYPPGKTALSGVTYPTPDSGGSMTVRTIVEALQPALVICGHYHQDFGKSDRMGAVRLVNPGPEGMILEMP